MTSPQRRVKKIAPAVRPSSVRPVRYPMRRSPLQGHADRNPALCVGTQKWTNGPTRFLLEMRERANLRTEITLNVPSLSNNNPLYYSWLRHNVQPHNSLSRRTATTTRFSRKAVRIRRRQGFGNNRSGGLLPRKHSPDGATWAQSTHPIKQACYLFNDLGRMKGWVGLVGWPVADGLLT